MSQFVPSRARSTVGLAVNRSTWIHELLGGATWAHLNLTDDGHVRRIQAKSANGSASLRPGASRGCCVRAGDRRRPGPHMDGAVARMDHAVERMDRAAGA